MQSRKKQYETISKFNIQHQMQSHIEEFGEMLGVDPPFEKAIRNHFQIQHSAPNAKPY